jgi:hypothetical protein
MARTRCLLDEPLRFGGITLANRIGEVADVPVLRRERRGE